jgi:Flp pilus assembly protein TadG
MTRAIRQCLRRLCRDQRGTAAVEFGIVAPVFFATLLGIVDVGRYMWTLNTMQYAVDQAIRTGVVQQLAPEDVEQQVKDALTGFGPVTVEAIQDPSTLTITATKTYAFMFPISAVTSSAVIDLRSEMPR